jgi:hypothetical protein
MKRMEHLAGESDDLVVTQALKNFKASVDAWSEAAMSRPRTVRTVRHSWRLSAGWALGCVLAAGSLTGGLDEHQHRKDLARTAAQQRAERIAQEQSTTANQPAASTPVREDQDLLAIVDSDVSREVPAAMEPLAQLMDDNGAK